MIIFKGWDCLYKTISDTDTKKNNKKLNVACILAYYNGQKYIQNQVESILKQKTNSFSLSLFICDDSSDIPFPKSKILSLENPNSCNIFYKKSKINYGYAYNFLNSLKLIENIFDYYCFSDQDDIWYEDKILDSIKILEKFPQEKPSLYSSRTNYFNEDCSEKIGSSFLFKRAPSFKNALVQNIAGGNTMTFNNCSRNLIVKSLNNLKIVSHDWWSYKIISGAGGNIFYDSKPSVKYRQHKSNMQGANNKLSDRLFRVKSLIQGNFRKWNNSNISSLELNKHLLTSKNQKVLENFMVSRNSILPKRIYLY